MALSSGRLVTSIISPPAGKGDPDCSKTKLTFRLHPRESKSELCMCAEIHKMRENSPSLLSGSYLAILLWRKGDEDYFSQKLRVRIKDNKNSPHGKFHRFLFPFSSKFSDLNFASYVLYNLPVLIVTCHTQWAWVTYGASRRVKGMFTNKNSQLELSLQQGMVVICSPKPKYPWGTKGGRFIWHFRLDRRSASMASSRGMLLRSLIFFSVLPVHVIFGFHCSH